MSAFDPVAFDSIAFDAASSSPSNLRRYRAIPGRAIPGRATPGWTTETETLAILVKVVSEVLDIGESSGTAVAIFRVVDESLEIGETALDRQLTVLVVDESLEIGEQTGHAFLFIFVAPLEVVAHMSATVRQATPDKPDSGSLFVRVADAPGESEVALVAVDHDITPGQGASVLKALLRLTLAEDLVGTHTFTVEPIDEPWDAATATYNNLPAVRAESASAIVSDRAKGDVVEIDITALVAESVALEDASGAQWNGLLLTGDDGTFYSAATTGFQPQIKAEVSRPPLAPFNLRPASGLAVSTLPVLEADFRDLDPTDVISGIHVQVSDVDDFETPLFDSGMVPAVTPRYDLTGASGLPGSGTLYWRMAYRDSRGIIGAFSPIESFSLVAKGTLEVEPIAPGPLPKTEAALTGATMQSFYLAWERKQGNAWVTHYELPWHLASAVDVDLPDDYILQEGVTYRRVLRVMDDAVRADLADDRAFYEDIEEMTVPAAVMA